MSPSEIAKLKFFCLNSLEFVTFNQIASIFFVFWGLCPRPNRGLCACTDSAGGGTHSFAPPKQIPGYAPGWNFRGKASKRKLKKTVFLHKLVYAHAVTQTRTAQYSKKTKTEEGRTRQREKQRYRGIYRDHSRVQSK